MDDPIVICAGCGKKYKWTPKVAGMSANCRCGMMVVMPSSPPATSYERPAPKPPKPVAAPPAEEDGGLSLGENPLFSLDTPMSEIEESTGAPAKPAAPDLVGDDEDSDDYDLDDGGKSKPAAGAGACPSCSAPIAVDAVICVKCGFNIKTGKKMDTATGDDAGKGGMFKRWFKRKEE
ncbi:MAG: hypothetical protein GC159_01600 [Phycisphaera sp.]|nr:hypothetical protein [Phycisphaera sp.]